MLMREATPQMLEEWRQIYDKYRPRLHPNRKPATKIIEYLKQKYPLTEIKDAAWQQIVIDNVLQNAHAAQKLPAGKTPVAAVFSIPNVGAGKTLYEQQDDVFRGTPIHVGIELETAFLHVEGSSLLWDELFAFRGLDADDLDNVYLVAEYIQCLERFDMLDNALIDL